MTPEAQRIAIAEACGWTDADFEGMYGRPHANSMLREPLPDYLNDLNAMHEAEKTLGEDQRREHAWFLVQIIDKFQTWAPQDFPVLHVWEMSLCDIADCLAATADQRAEAFLRTLGLWEEKTP